MPASKFGGLEAQSVDVIAVPRQGSAGATVWVNEIGEGGEGGDAGGGAGGGGGEGRRRGRRRGSVRLVIDAVPARLGGGFARCGLVMLFTLKSLACEFKPATAVRSPPHLRLRLRAAQFQGLDP